MIYTIDRITPNEGFNRANMIDNGDYYLEQIMAFCTLEEAIAALGQYVINDKTSDYDLKTEERVIMGSMNGKLFID